MEPPPVQIESSLRSWKINERCIRALVQDMAGRLGVDGMDVHIQFIGPSAMKRINRQFRQKDQSTDVLSFPQMEWNRPLLISKDKSGAPARRGQRGDLRNTSMLRGTRAGLQSFAHERVLGDLVLCLDAAARNAREDKSDVAKEVCFLLAHGMLHLCGHDHQNSREKALMFAQQDQLMAGIGSRWRGCVARVP